MPEEIAQLVATLDLDDSKFKRKMAAEPAAMAAGMGKLGGTVKNTGKDIVDTMEKSSKKASLAYTRGLANMVQSTITVSRAIRRMMVMAIVPMMAVAAAGWASYSKSSTKEGNVVLSQINKLKNSIKGRLVDSFHVAITQSTFFGKTTLQWLEKISEKMNKITTRDVKSFTKALSGLLITTTLMKLFEGLQMINRYLLVAQNRVKIFSAAAEAVGAGAGISTAKNVAKAAKKDTALNVLTATMIAGATGKKSPYPNDPAISALAANLTAMGAAAGKSQKDLAIDILTKRPYRPYVPAGFSVKQTPYERAFAGSMSMTASGNGVRMVGNSFKIIGTRAVGLVKSFGPLVAIITLVAAVASKIKTPDTIKFWLDTFVSIGKAIEPMTSKLAYGLDIMLKSLGFFVLSLTGLATDLLTAIGNRDFKKLGIMMLDMVTNPVGSMLGVSGSVSKSRALTLQQYAMGNQSDNTLVPRLTPQLFSDPNAFASYSEKAIKAAREDGKLRDEIQYEKDNFRFGNTGETLSAADLVGYVQRGQIEWSKSLLDYQKKISDLTQKQYENLEELNGNFKSFLDTPKVTLQEIQKIKGYLAN